MVEFLGLVSKRITTIGKILQVKVQCTKTKILEVQFLLLFLVESLIKVEKNVLTNISILKNTVKLLFYFLIEKYLFGKFFVSNRNFISLHVKIV